MTIATTNPATGETVRTFTPLDETDLDARLEAARAAYTTYRLTTTAQRAEWLTATAEVLERQGDEVSELMTLEMGKTLAASRGEVAKCVRALRWYAGHGPAMLAPQQYDAAAVGAREAVVRFDPIGPVLAVMPWNFPLWQTLRFAAPTLMAGNVALLKHASNVPQTALRLEQLFLDAGLPTGVFQTLLIGSGAVSRVIADPRVAAVTLTGSNPAGEAVGAAAGAAVKKVVLELGGSDPFVVMPSADLARAAEVAVTTRCQNNGQSCIAAKRFIVHESVADAFEEEFRTRLEQLVVGDPRHASTDVGPLATEGGREDVEELVRDAVDHGARVVTGGVRPDGPGWFYPPTLLADLTPEMRVYREEVFGPVALMFRVPDLDEAIALANDTEFGLGSNIWSEDRVEQDRFIRDSEAGMVFVNGMTTSYPELPFGGVKASGVGRELSDLGMKEFTNLKTVWVAGG